MRQSRTLDLTGDVEVGAAGWERLDERRDVAQEGERVLVKIGLGGAEDDAGAAAAWPGDLRNVRRLDRREGLGQSGAGAVQR